MYNFYVAPSFYAHIINGLLMLAAFVLLYKNYSKITKLEPYKLILLTLILSICVGVHGLSHLGLETIYNYNPLIAA
jgi:tetrahydromethanopterin S-methyltransferase subunit E